MLSNDAGRALVHPLLNANARRASSASAGLNQLFFLIIFLYLQLRYFIGVDISSLEVVNEFILLV